MQCFALALISIGHRTSRAGPPPLPYSRRIGHPSTYPIPTLIRIVAVHHAPAVARAEQDGAGQLVGWVLSDYRTGLRSGRRGCRTACPFRGMVPG